MLLVFLGGKLPNAIEMQPLFKPMLLFPRLARVACRHELTQMVISPLETARPGCQTRGPFKGPATRGFQPGKAGDCSLAPSRAGRPSWWPRARAGSGSEPQ